MFLVIAQCRQTEAAATGLTIGSAVYCRGIHPS